MGRGGAGRVWRRIDAISRARVERVERRASEIGGLGRIEELGRERV